MAIFNDKIVSAQFINPEKTLIEILYKENDKVIPYVLEVDFTQDNFQDLLKELTLDEIEENSKLALEQESKFFESVINDEIERRWAAELDKIEKAYVEVDKTASAEIQKRWTTELDKIEEAYANAYAEIDKTANAETDKRWANELIKIEKAYAEVDKTLKQEYEKIKNEYEKINNIASAEIQKRWDDELAKVKEEYGKIDEVAKAEIDKRWIAELDKIEKAYAEVDETAKAEVDKRWNDELAKVKEIYQDADKYSEEEKSKKMAEVESEMKKMRQKLQSGFTMNVKTDPTKPKDIINSFVDNNEDKDFVFGMKVSILEDPIIAKSKDKAMKMEIRKAKTVMELLKIYTTQKV